VVNEAFIEKTTLENSGYCFDGESEGEPLQLFRRIVGFKEVWAQLKREESGSGSVESSKNQLLLSPLKINGFGDFGDALDHAVEVFYVSKRNEALH